MRAALANIKFHGEHRSESWPLSRFFNRVAHALFPPVSAVCGRGMSESILRSRRSRVRQRVERVQSWRVRPCAGQTVPGLARRKNRLGAAGLRSDHQLSAVRGARQRPVALSSRFSDEVLVPAIARVGHETTKTGGLEWNHPNWRKRPTRAMASVRTPGVTPGLTCEGVRPARVSGSGATGTRAGVSIQQELTFAGARP